LKEARVSKKPSPTLVGAFVVGAALLLVAAVAVWGSGRLFDRRYQYVCYFPGSVNGLKIGAAVKYRGVPIGQVIGMRIHFQQPKDDTRIPFFVEMSGKRLHDLGASEAPTPKIVQELIDAGLRARLETESFVTGQLYVNLDMHPEIAARMLHAGGGYSEIPTIPAPLEEAQKSLSGLVAQLKTLDLSGTAQSLSSAIEGINKLVNTPSVARTIRELPSTVASVRHLVENVDAGLDKIGKGLQTSLAVRGPVFSDLQRTLNDVQRAADSIRELADYLRRNPNALITGRKRP
jgi:paraquat-inducible protein B